MSQLSIDQFLEFFEAVYGYEPFPWQRMLLERVAKRGWPEGISLPTASGKTACIDIAVFNLALRVQEDGRLEASSTARRRIFFVVDRRIVVDEAFRRAQALAEKLAQATDGVLAEVARRLRALSQSETPLVVSRLRGGTLQDDAWALNPLQPAIVSSTVDQIGSRLLFRSYGSGALSAPIEAGLTAYESLLLLDEAHCAVPFLQTARRLQRYIGPEWAQNDCPCSMPLSVSILSATLPDEVEDVFPAPEDREPAFDNKELQDRINASKPTRLLVGQKPRKREWTLGDRLTDDDFVLAAAQHAANFAAQEHRRVAVMVNRVATAGAIYEQLANAADKGTLNADVVLMTGRMRLIERDELVARWEPLLKAGSSLEPQRPVIVVTTQCLEVGADFSFDALVTECASLDALRQRFGRLDRLGRCRNARAVVLIRKSDAKPNDKLDDAKPLDPIYGNALARTWNWLNAHTQNGSEIDFGIAAFDAIVPKDNDELRQLLAPTADAPVLMPAHVDLLCQTAPRPEPDPDVAIFLHGPKRGVPEARVVFRADLPIDQTEKWPDALALMPPLPIEALSVPLHLLNRWLAEQPVQDAIENIGDTETQRRTEETEPQRRSRPFIIWKGKNESRVSCNTREIAPEQTIVVPADETWAAQLGHAFARLPDLPLDLAELAYKKARETSVLRLTSNTFGQWAENPAAAELLSWAQDEDRDPADLADLLQTLAAGAQNEEPSTPLPDWLKQIAHDLSTERLRIETHPAGGLVLFGQRVEPIFTSIDASFADEEDSLSITADDITLDTHTAQVKAIVQKWASALLPGDVADALAIAALWHDAGKADPRFQIVLHGDELAAAIALANGQPLAKSRRFPFKPSAQQRLRKSAQLPKRFRHEMLSAQIVERCAQNEIGSHPRRELILHLIESHHGHARPFAPVVLDTESPAVRCRIGERTVELSDNERRGIAPSHRLDSGIAERFWKLTRQHGWWGLAYLEAILRLADRYASRMAESQRQ